MDTRGQYYYEFLDRLSFTRVSGSPQELQAAQMLAEEIRSYGLNPELEPFAISRHLPVVAKLRVTAPVEKEYTITGHINAGSTPPGGVDAEFYYMETINPFSLRKAAGKFVLLNSRPKEEDYRKLTEAGIAGFLLISGTVRDTPENSDLETGLFRECYHRYGDVPAFTIRALDALELVRSQPKTVHFELLHELWSSTSHNVVTVIPGTDKADEAICVGAHYDSVEFSKGSWDNGSSTVGILALLRHLAEHPPRRTVKAVLFGSEEMGLLGAKAYLAAHAEDREKLLFMVNHDMTGNVLGYYWAGVTATSEAEQYISHLMRELGWWMQVSSTVASSDSAVFSDWGIPSITLARSSDNPVLTAIHSRYDDMRLISPQAIGDDIDMLIAFVTRLTDAEIFPIEKKLSEEMVKGLIKYFGTGLSNSEKIQQS